MGLITIHKMIELSFQQIPSKFDSSRIRSSFTEINVEIDEKLFQELRQQFEEEKCQLRAQWLNELNRTQSEQQQIEEEFRSLRENYTNQVKKSEFQHFHLEFFVFF